MENSFEEEIKRLEQQVIELKTCPIKTASQMATKSIDQPVSYNLSYSAQLSPNFAWGENTVVITMTSTNGTNMLTSCYVKNSDDASGHNLQGRGISTIPTQAGSTAQYKVSLFSRNPNDISTLAGGGSVTLNYNFVLTATSDFTVTITTEPYNPF